MGLERSFSNEEHLLLLREPESHFQHLHQDSQKSITLFPGDPMPPPSLHRPRHSSSTDTHAGKHTHTYKTLG